MSSGTAVIYYADGSVDSVEKGLRLYFETWPQIRALAFGKTGSQVTWSRSGDDLYFRQVVEQISDLLNGRGFCLQTDVVNGITIIRVIPEGQPLEW